MWRVEKLNKSRHDRSHFDCGKPVLNEWLQKQASQWDRKGLSRTFVAVDADAYQVLGYYSLSSHSVEYEALEDDEAHKLPRVHIPVALLGKLAVDHSQQGRGLGRFLLLNAMARVVQFAEQVGIRAIEVDAIDEPARQFYLKYGFTSLRDDEKHLFLSMKSIRTLSLPPPL